MTRPIKHVPPIEGQRASLNCVECETLPVIDVKDCLPCGGILCIACPCATCDRCSTCCMCPEGYVSVWDAQAGAAQARDDYESQTRLWCKGCSSFTDHDRTEEKGVLYIWCVNCMRVYEDDVDEITDTEHDATTRIYRRVFCGECDAWVAHRRSGTTASDNPAWICNDCNYLNPNGNKDVVGKYTDISGTERPIYQERDNSVTAPPATSNYSYGGYGSDSYSAWSRNCIHWRDPIQVGHGTVLASASSDRNTAAARNATVVPDYGVYLSPTWDATVMVTPDFPTDQLPLVSQYPCVFYTWTDMKAPRDPQIQQIVDWMVPRIQEGVKFDIGCMGSHGRTGTLLALLLIEVEGLNATEAIEAVRERHCVNAIETIAQENYIYLWNNEPLPVRITHTTNSTSGGNRKGSNAKGYRYPSAQARKAAKKTRKTRRAERKELIQTARATCLNEGRTWPEYRERELERTRDLFYCVECEYLDTFISTRGKAKFATMSTYIMCADCKETTEHRRPEGLD